MGLKKIFVFAVLHSLVGWCSAEAVDTMMTDCNVWVSSLTAKPRFPWNGKVDIDLTLGCDIPEAYMFVNFAASYVDKRGETVQVPMKTFEQFTVAFCTNAGTYRVTWDAAVDAPNLRVANLKYMVTANMAKYMIVDLSKGVEADAMNPYPITYLDECPDPTRDDGGWTDEYKTTKMVFRLVQPGTFKMGWSHDGFGSWSDGSRHTATITRPYYLAIFECTQGQAKQISGSYIGSQKSEFKGVNRDRRPVGCANFGIWRGFGTASTRWPFGGSEEGVDPNSLIGKLRLRTGNNVGFDLPTETEWEFAARAGHADAWGNGTISAAQGPVESASDGTGAYTNSWLNAYARYIFNGGYIDNGDGTYTKPDFTSEANGTAVVGSYKPNDWGFYDTLGNVRERVLDAFRKLPKADMVDDVGETNIVKEVGEVIRTCRGGHWDSLARSASLVSRWSAQNESHAISGARLCWRFPTKGVEQ